MSDPNVDAMENRDRAARRETERSGVEERDWKAEYEAWHSIARDMLKTLIRGCPDLEYEGDERQFAEKVAGRMTRLRERLEEVREERDKARQEANTWRDRWRNERGRVKELRAELTLDSRRQRDRLREAVREAKQRLERIGQDFRFDEFYGRWDLDDLRQRLSNALDDHGSEGEEPLIDHDSYEPPEDLSGVAVHGADADEVGEIKREIRLMLWENGEVSVTEQGTGRDFSMTHEDPLDVLDHVRALLYTSDRDLTEAEKEHGREVADGLDPTGPPDEGEAENPYDRTIREIEADPYCGPADDQPGEDGVGELETTIYELESARQPAETPDDLVEVPTWAINDALARLRRLTDRPAPDGREREDRVSCPGCVGSGDCPVCRGDGVVDPPNNEGV